MMTVQEKLEYLYEEKRSLHPLTKMVIVFLVETQKSKLSEIDEDYVNEIFTAYTSGE